MIDLHIHTTNSDGEFGVVEILEKANLKRLDVISITDHNNINAYDELGIKYSLDLKISKPNHMANDVLVDDILKYSDNKEILSSMNIVDRSSFYRKHFCEVSSPFYIDQTAGKKDIFYVTSLIHDAGGLCFLAHPFVYNLPNIKETLDEIVSLDIIDGIECAHRKHTEEQINFLITNDHTVHGH